MPKPSKIAQEIIEFLEEKTKDLSVREYKEVLEEVSSSIDIKTDAAQYDKD